MIKIKKEVEEEVSRLAEPLIAYNGMELVPTEYVRGPAGNVLRLVIDRPGGSHPG